MTNQNTLKTKNEGYGFYGTIGRRCDADRAWAAALLGIVDATDCSHKAARWFLDSTHGRHFADEVVGFLADGRAHTTVETAIAEAILKWQSWKIGRRMSRDTGIPAGLRYLTGLVANADIEAEAEADAISIG